MRPSGPLLIPVILSKSGKNLGMKCQILGGFKILFFPKIPRIMKREYKYYGRKQRQPCIEASIQIHNLREITTNV